MRVRLAALAAGSAVIAFALPSHAATVTKKVTLVTDTAGDAAPAPDAADIRAVTATNTFKKKTVHGVVKYIPTGASIALQLAAAPDNNTFYSITANSTGSCSELAFFYDNSPSPAYQQNRAACLDSNEAVGSTTIAGVTGKVIGNSVVFKLPLSLFPVGTSLTKAIGETDLGPAPVLIFDDTSASKAKFTIGRR